jgi:hypothetical protein
MIRYELLKTNDTIGEKHKWRMDVVADGIITDILECDNLLWLIKQLIMRELGWRVIELRKRK